MQGAELHHILSSLFLFCSCNCVSHLKSGSNMPTLRVLVLNCWGVFVPGAVKYRRQRIEAIGDEVSHHKYDLVVFCEVWLKSDYKRLCQRLLGKLPYSHYFYSGCIGSGVCVFSVNPLRETIFHHYTLNGFAHKPQHGDWFGGKGVGLCKINVDGMKINVYCSHIHAEYRRDQDEYLAHRVSQAYELSQFVKMTSETCDVVLIGGDLNIEPVDLGYKIIRTNANMCDSWMDKKRTTGYEHGNTCEVPSNSFAVPLPGYPEGKRIDYLMYRTNPGWKLVVEECSVIMNRIPERDYNFSDHEAVMAVLKIEKGQSQESAEEEEKRLLERDSLLEKAVATMKQGLMQTEGDQSFFQIQVLVLSVVLYFLEMSGSLVSTDSVPIILPVLKLLVIGAIVLCAWTGFIVKRIEVHGFQAVIADVANLLESSTSARPKKQTE